MEEDETIRPVEMAVWSPDGQLIAFAADLKQPSCSPSCRKIGVLQIADGSIKFLEAPRGQIIDLPRWTVDGRLLVIIHSGDPANGVTYVFARSGNSAAAEGTYELSSSHEGQKWYPWKPGKVWTAGVDRPDSYYNDG